jgi:hypothetical protein
MNAPLSQLDVIRIGAAQASHRTNPCPFCGEDPPLAPLPIASRYVVGCENDDCHARPQTAGSTLAEAWARWNWRAAA